MGIKILGIAAFYHDSAAALIVNGEIVAAAQEERFTRKKHDAGFPGSAIKGWLYFLCLFAGGSTAIIQAPALRLGSCSNEAVAVAAW